MNTTIPKLLTALAWAILLYNLFFPLNPPIGTWLTYGFWGLLAAHAVEIVIFQKRVLASGAPLLNSMLILVFGYFRVLELRTPTTA